MRSPQKILVQKLLVAALLMTAGTGCAGIGKPHKQPTSYRAPSTDDGVVGEDEEKALGDPFLIEGILRQEQLPLLKGPQPLVAELSLVDAPPGVPPPPASCDVLARHPVGAAGKATGPGLCADLPTAKARLDAALAQDTPEKRDQALAAAESCTALPPGLVRSLRAELAPPACGDALVRPFLAAKPDKVPGAIQHALVGHALAARLHRAVTPPPKLDPPHSKERVAEFHKGPLRTWLEAQAAAVQALSVQGAQLSSYGKGVVATAAGIADLRLVDAVRSVPIPAEYASDPELSEAYYASLDEALEPRKTRGRDGALVGLREMHMAGVLRDGRTDEARSLLSKLYGGRRVDALDALALPRLAEAPRATVDQRLAAALPTFQAGYVLEPPLVLDPGVLRGLLERGIPLPHRAHLRDGAKELAPAVRSLAARGRVGLGIRTWHAVDFDEAIALLQGIPASDARPEHRLLLAIAIALRSGPDDLVELMRTAGAPPRRFGDVRALEVVANEAGSLAPLAAFDAALLRELAAPQAAPAAYFRDVATRWRKAARMAKEAGARSVAEDRANAMDAIAAELSPKR